MEKNIDYKSHTAVFLNTYPPSETQLSPLLGSSKPILETIRLQPSWFTPYNRCKPPRNNWVVVMALLAILLGIVGSAYCTFIQISYFLHQFFSIKLLILVFLDVP